MTIFETIRSLSKKQWNHLRYWVSNGGITKFIAHKEKMGLVIRGKLLVWSFQPAKQKLKDVPIFTFVDIVRFPTNALLRKHPGNYFKFLKNFWIYRKNMPSKIWSSLTMYYSRPFILWYYYLLFWWAEYCGVLPELLRHPDPSIIPELFIRYIVEIDSIIDSKVGQEYLLRDYPFIKRNCAHILKELLIQIGENKLAHDNGVGKELCKKIWRFRQESLVVSRNSLHQPALVFDDLLKYKDKTAGDLFRVWVDLLCDVYHVTSRVENSKSILGWVAMVIQVVDDMLDSPMDYQDDVSNIFNSLLKETPNEFEVAQAYYQQNPSGYLDWIWANKYLPNTCTYAVDLITSNIECISSISENQEMTSELCAILQEWRVQNPER